MPFIQARPTIQRCADGAYPKPAEPGSYNLIDEQGRYIGWLLVEPYIEFGESVLHYTEHLDERLPHRRFEMHLDLEADTLEALLARLDTIHLHLVMALDAGELTMPHTSVTGGYDAGWTLSIHDDPMMTHNLYIQQIEAWKERRQRASAAQEG